jgi:hypothetical protein
MKRYGKSRMRSISHTTFLTVKVLHSKLRSTRFGPPLSSRRPIKGDGVEEALLQDPFFTDNGFLSKERSYRRGHTEYSVQVGQKWGRHPPQLGQEMNSGSVIGVALELVEHEGAT